MTMEESRSDATEVGMITTNDDHPIQNQPRLTRYSASLAILVIFTIRQFRSDSQPPTQSFFMNAAKIEQVRRNDVVNPITSKPSNITTSTILPNTLRGSEIEGSSPKMALDTRQFVMNRSSSNNNNNNNNSSSSSSSSSSNENQSIQFPEQNHYEKRNIRLFVETNETIINQLAKPYQEWDASTTQNNKFGWCVADNTTAGGIYFTKTPKAASSTGAGVTGQIAYNIYERYFNHNNLQQDGPPNYHHRACNHWNDHGRQYTARKYPYLAWTSLRKPDDRVVSNFWFRQVTRRNLEPTDELILDYLKNLQSFQLIYIAQLESKTNDTKRPELRYYIKNEYKGGIDPLNHAIEMIQKDVLDVYNFIAIAERMSESLVVLKLLFGLEYRDVIVLPSKKNGGYDDGAYDGNCHKIQKPRISPVVADYLQNEFPVHNYDYLLYAVANKSLDLTIEMLGKELVESQLQEFNRLQALAEEKCMDEAMFPCSSEGTFQPVAAEKNCLRFDQGCGHECVQRVLLDEALSTQASNTSSR